MIIRRLERADYNQVCDLMIQFAHLTGMNDLNLKTYDREHANQVLLRCEKTGASFVAQEGQEIVGLILSMRAPELWQPNIIRLRELAWFVREDYRKTTTGARLFTAYNQAAEQMKFEGKITGYTISKMWNSHDFDYERRGYQFLESTYIKS